jgi:hypothetical protein
VALLSIPKEHQAGLAKLQALPDRSASKLLLALKSAAEKTQNAYLSPEDLGEFEGVSSGELEQILDAVSGTYHARAHAEVSLSEFVKDVTETMRSGSQANLSSENAIRHFEDRLTEFLSLPALARAAKGDILMYEHERNVHELRILTDARPIFGEDVQAPPEAIEITHTLKIAYYRGNQMIKEYFALDDFDLADLKRVVERAELKAKSLRAALKNSGMRVLREE